MIPRTLMEPAQTSSLARDSWVTRGANHFGIPRREFIAVTSLFAVMIAFKMLNMMRFRFDSDEPQHLHVIWAWARGFVQYRDVFDNHMPLFQIMFAPIFGLIGDRPTILYWMRFILLPMYFVAAWCTYRVGTLLFSRRVGAWAVILAGGSTSYHFISFEFRTDNLWAPLWLLCIVVLLGGAMNVRRAMVAGLLLGFCFGISMKSSLLLLSLFVAALIALLLVGREQLGKSWAQLIQYAATFLGTTLLVPATIMIFFAGKGLWRDFRHCVFDHNFLPHLDAKNSPVWLIVIFPIAFPLVVYIARMLVRATPDPALGFRRGFVFIICGFYLTALYSFWNLITRQDFLPYHPLAFVFFTAAVLAICDSEKFRSGLSPRLRRVSWPVWLTILGLLVTLVTRPFWINGAKIETELLRDVLKLTEPGDFVFDCKGETIFRQRCFRPILEPVTFERIQRKMIVDDVAQQCVKTLTCLVAPTGSTPWYARQFIAKNYLPVKGFVRVAGGYMKESTTQSGTLEFESVIPASYKLITRAGNVEGLLDGEAYSSARFLNPGKHLFAPSNKTGPVAFIWARAIDLHYSPFDYVPPKSREK